MVRLGPGADFAQDETGDDVLRGGEGDDRFEALGICCGAAANLFAGGPGRDTLRVGHFTDSPYVVDLTMGLVLEGGDEEDTLEDIERVVAGFGDDMLIGDAADNDLRGGSGSDQIEGREGDDLLAGESGNDFLDRGDGQDRLNGGANTDECLNGETVLNCEA